MTKNTDAGNFEALLAAINGQSENTDTLAKSMADGGCDDAKIEAAAAEGAEGGDDVDKDKKDKLAGDEADETFGKSFKMVDAEGKEVDGYDATELLKSMLSRQETLEANSTKGLNAIFGLVKQQGDLIKSLSDRLGAMSAQGRGRKAVLAVAEKLAPADLAKSHTPAGASADAAAAAEQEGGMPKEEFFAKALEAAAAGLVGYHQVNLSETLVNKGGTPVPEVMAAVSKLVAAGK